MRLIVRFYLEWLSESLCTLLRLVRRSHGRHGGLILASEPWLPSTPLPAPVVPELHHPRVPRYVETKPACGEWLSREYAILYQWVAEMELSIYASDLRARSYVHAAA